MTDRERLVRDLKLLSLPRTASKVRRGDASEAEGLTAIERQLVAHERSPYMGKLMTDWCERAKAVLSTYGVGV